MSLKRILVAIALEEDSAEIAARAVQLSLQQGAEILAVHVAEDPPAFAEEMLPARDLDALSEQLLAQRTAQLRALFAGTSGPVSALVETGKPHVVIERLARSLSADLIVIGPGHAKSLREKVLGSTADRVIRRAPCPVLVVRGKVPAPYRRVTIGVDFSDCASAAARHASKIAPCSLQELLHTVEIPLMFEQAMLKTGTPQAQIDRYRKARALSSRARLLQLFGENGKLPDGARIRIEHGEPATVLLRATHQRRADLVVIGTQGAGAVSQHLLGSVARKVLAGAKCDVLVVPVSALEAATDAG